MRLRLRRPSKSEDLGRLQGRPKPDLGQLSRCCVAASPKQPFDTLCSIFVGLRSAERAFPPFACAAIADAAFARKCGEHLSSTQQISLEPPFNPAETGAS